MFTFMTAYLIVWLAVLAYMLRLGGEQRHLRRVAETLQKQLQERRPPSSALDSLAVRAQEQSEEQRPPRQRAA